MLNNPVFHYKPKTNLNKDFVKFEFDLRFKNIPNEVVKDDEFIFEDELLLVNFGEKSKFTSDYIYQSKLVAFKDPKGISFGGYSPDWRRKADLIKDKNGNTIFDENKSYHIKITLSKYRCFITINNGEAKDIYGNARDEIEDVAIYLNKEVEAEITNEKVVEFDNPYKFEDKTILALIEKGCFFNYLNYHIDEYGLTFDRLNIIQNIKCTTRNSGQYNTNLMLDFVTNSKKVVIEYTILDTEVPDYNFKIGFLINNKIIKRKIKKVNKQDTFVEEFVINNRRKENRVTFVFPTSFAVGIRKITLDENSLILNIKKEKTFVFLGDSITEGAECFDPEWTYFNQLTRHYNANGYNFAISGSTFNDHDLDGEFNFSPDVIFIANGTNSYCMGTDEKEHAFTELERNMLITLNSCKKYFPKAQIIALLPIWRSDESGPKFSLKETSEKMKDIYQKFDISIIIIDCYDFIKHNSKYFSNSDLALHPNTSGHKQYGKKLLKTIHF